MRALDLDLSPRSAQKPESETTQAARLQPQIHLAVTDQAFQDLRCVLAGS